LAQRLQVHLLRPGQRLFHRLGQAGEICEGHREEGPEVQGEGLPSPVLGPLQRFAEAILGPEAAEEGVQDFPGDLPHLEQVGELLAQEDLEEQSDGDPGGDGHPSRNRHGASFAELRATRRRGRAG
jgi:hypothetical protein